MTTVRIYFQGYLDYRVAALPALCDAMGWQATIPPDQLCPALAAATAQRLLQRHTDQVNKRILRNDTYAIDGVNVGGPVVTSSLQPPPAWEAGPWG